MNVYNTGILIHSEARLTVNPEKCELTPPYRPISQSSNPGKNQNGAWKKEDCSGRKKSAHCPLEFLHVTLLSKIHEAVQGAGMRLNPTFSPFLWKSQCSMHCKIWLVLFPCPSKSNPSSAQQKMANQHSPFPVICSKLDSHGLCLELLLFLLVLKAIDVEPVTTVFCSVVLDGSEQPSIYHSGGPEQHPNSLHKKWRLGLTLFGSSHLSVLYIGR